MKDIVPESTVEQSLDRADAPFVVDVRMRLQVEHQALPDRERQRQLLERLRVKYQGPPHAWIQSLGDFLRRWF